MFKKLKNFVSRESEKIIRDPAHASRAALASVLILGIFSLSLNLGSQIAPELLGASIGSSISAESTLKYLESKNAAERMIVERTTTCLANRAGGSANKLLKNYEDSVSGILPGAGKLVLSDPAAVSDRRKQLVIRLLRKYANLQYCIPEDSFDEIYFHDYSPLSQNLSTYLQAYLQESDPDNYPSGEVHNVFVSDFSAQYRYVEQDLIAKENYLNQILDEAIDSAVELDQRTENGAATLAAATANRIAMIENYIAEKNGEVLKNSAVASAASSQILNDLREMLALDNTIPKNVGSGGSYEREPLSAEMIRRISEAKGNIPVSPMKIASGYPNLPPVGTKIKNEVDRLIAGNKISYGLLNLFPIEERMVLADYFGMALPVYAGVKLGLDPLTPGYENDIAAAAEVFATKINDPEDDQICYSLDPSQLELSPDKKTCFGVEMEELPNTDA